jgi:peptidoglycan/LPS O-acetylase OafA/YrhL
MGAAPVAVGSGLAFSPALHGLRGLAAMAVLAFHWSQHYPLANGWLAQWQWGPLPWMNISLPLALGWQGVPLFFVLSAYLLTAQWHRQPLAPATVGHYVLRRALRIYPAVWFQMALVLCVLPWLPTLWRTFTLSELWQSALLWINMPPTMVAPLNLVWWTLPIEFSFYLALPLLVGLSRRVGWLPVVLVSFVVTVAWRSAVMAWFAGEHMVARLPILDALPGSLATFAAGFALAHHQGRWPARVPWPVCAMWLIAYLGLQYGLLSNVDTYWTGHWMLAVWNPLFACVVALAVGVVMSDVRWGRWFSGAWMVWLGELSFGIYLWHFPVLIAMRQLWPASEGSIALGLLALPLCVVLTLLLAWASHTLVERPAMRLFRAR